MTPRSLSPATRREVSALLRLAVPVVTVQVGMMLMGVVDAMMLGRVSAEALAAGALGNTVAFGVLMLPMGILMGLDPLITQAFGADDMARVGVHMRRGAALAVVLTVPVSVVLARTEPLLELLGQVEGVRGPAASYMRWLIPGNLAFLLFGVARQTLQGMSRVWPAVAAIVVANLFNGVANYALVFGHFGLPRLEVVGSAMATSMSRWVLLLVLVAIAWPVLGDRLRDGEQPTWRLAAFRRILAIGVPVGLQVSLEVWVFSTVAVLMGSLGATELAGHQIALSLAGLSFMVPLGVAAAATTRVGNALGRGDQPAAALSARLSLILGAGFMACMGVVFSLLPEPLARLYSNQVEVVTMAAALIPIAGAFQIADGTQVVGAGVLRGTADTRFPAILAFVGYWLLGLPAGLLLAFRLAYGPQGLWWGLTLGLASVAALFLIRIRVRFAAEIPLVVHD